LGHRRWRNRALTAPQSGVLWLGLLLGLLLPHMSQSLPNTAPPERVQLVWLTFDSASQVETWVRSGLDVWDVDGNRALVQVPAHQLAALRSAGVAATAVERPTSLSFPGCYRTYAELGPLLADRAAHYPDLIDLFDRGDTWEKQYAGVDRDIWAVRLTSPRGPDEKPKLLIVAEQHAREIITPEVALEFIDDLLTGYGSDATATWLLDAREVWVVPMANPDGYVRAARAEDWRKNAGWPKTCINGVPPWSYGVDLNRNFGIAWEMTAGSSTEPCSLIYRGTAPYSEPETVALRDLMLAERFDFIILLHSYGDEILFPWAHTRDPVPDAAVLEALAGRMAAEVGYTAQQASTMYPASGDAMDWSYGELGVASLTVEIGSMEDGMFWPDCDTKPTLYQEVRGALIYAALAAADPYSVAGGPDARQIEVALEDSNAVIRAHVSDAWTGGDVLAGAELFLEIPGAPGAGVPLVPVDGAVDSVTEWMQAELDEDDLMRYAEQQVPLAIVAEDAAGHRGVPMVAWLDLRSYRVPANREVGVWIDDGAEPTYEVRGDYVYGGAADRGPVLLTVTDGQVYRGAGTDGELLFTLGPDWVRVAENGPIAYTLHSGRLYEGQYAAGNPLYRIDYYRLVAVDLGRGVIVAQADVNLNADAMERVRLLLPILLEQRY
jgi:murein tripeptide amidase MpaA